MIALEKKHRDQYRSAPVGVDVTPRVEMGDADVRRMETACQSDGSSCRTDRRPQRGGNGRIWPWLAPPRCVPVPSVIARWWTFGTIPRNGCVIASRLWKKADTFGASYPPPRYALLCKPTLKRSIPVDPICFPVRDVRNSRPPSWPAASSAGSLGVCNRTPDDPVQGICRRANLRPFTPHQFRHFIVNTLMKRGTRIETIAR